MTRRSLLLGFSALLAACATSDAPSDPVWGKEPCAHCAMVISDRRFAAEIVSAGGDRYFFDDPGCMAVFADQRHLEGARAWVYDVGGRRWVDARSARYAAGATSPMDFGFEPSASGAVAWSELRARALAKGKRTP